MKAKLKVLLPGFTGNMNDVVVYNSKLNKYITRKKIMPKFTPDHSLTREMHAFRRRINVSEGYIDDCREFIRLFNQKFRRQGRAMSTWPNVYMKIIRTLKRQFPEIDFKTFTREDVLEYNLPCKTVAAAIEAGYLEKVPGYEKLDRAL